MNVLVALWWLGIALIFWAMVGYPLSLVMLDRLFNRYNRKDPSLEPTVTVMVVAHNEEKVIREKLENLLHIDYPQDKIKFLVASDYSTDATNAIVRQFAAAHPEASITLNESKRHLGKTNAQDEAQELCDTDILVMTDANAMLQPDAVRELVSYFADDSVAYVSGQLRYRNAGDSDTAASEGLYWRLDLMCRDVESRFQTITAGNGAIYAVRNALYRKIPPIECHDSSFPVIYALEKRRALYNPLAVAYEKAGETNDDEFKRKVRMNRTLPRSILPDWRILNVFVYRWFSYFYFGHRTCRYLLWFLHLMVFVLNIPLALWGSTFWRVMMLLQVVFYLVGYVGWVTKATAGPVRMIAYYCMTVAAQWVGLANSLSGKSKATWDAAASTR